MSYHCGKINFIINIWDLDHKKNSPYSAHNKSYIYEKREKFLNLYRNKIYKEIFKQKSIYNKEIWVCSSNSYIFCNIEYFDSTIEGIVILSAIDEHPMIPNFRFFLIIGRFSL